MEQLRALRVFAVVFCTVCLTALFHSGCKAPSNPAPNSKTIVQWRTLGSWSGRGNAQTESFTMDSGAMRVVWETRNETVPGAGAFRLTVHSAISGRPLLVAVDHRGPGRDTSYLQEDPRVFYGVVESTSLEWSFKVEEAIFFTSGP
jgi:hypothetical protein